MMAARCPPNQTVVLKWLSDDTATRVVERFVKFVTPEVNAIFFTQDRALLLEGYKLIAYLNYSSAALADASKKKLDEAIVAAKRHNPPFDCSHVVTFMKDKGFQPESKQSAAIFPVWVGNVMEEDETDLEQVFKQFGPLCAPPDYVPIRVFSGSNKSAIVNFTTFRSALAVVEACQRRQLKFGGGMIAIAQPRNNTKFIMNLEDLLFEHPKACMSFAEVQKIADASGIKVHWVPIASSCPDRFDIDEKTSTVSLKSLATPTQPPKGASGEVMGTQNGKGELPLENAPFRPATGQGNFVGSMRGGVAASQPINNGTEHGRMQLAGLDGAGRVLERGWSVSGVPPSSSAKQEYAIAVERAEPAPPSAASSGLAREGQPAAAAKGVAAWSVEDVCGVMARCGFEAAVGSVRANGIDGKTLMDLMGDEEGRALLALPAEQGGVGLKPIQLRRVQTEMRATTAPVAAEMPLPADAVVVADKAKPVQDRGMPAVPAATAAQAARRGWAVSSAPAAMAAGGAGGADGAAHETTVAAHETTVCPISLEVMTDPVMAMDGHTYDRASIEAWFRRGQTTSPYTGLPLPSLQLIPNFAVRSFISSPHPHVQLRPYGGAPCDGKERS